jgi:replicative DNA helicase
MIAKHNGSIENVRLKFVASRKNLMDQGIAVIIMMIPSSMNQDGNAFQTKVYPRHEAFGSNLNDDDDDSDIPEISKPSFIEAFY